MNTKAVLGIVGGAVGAAGVSAYTYTRGQKSGRQEGVTIALKAFDQNVKPIILRDETTKADYSQAILNSVEQIEEKGFDIRI